MNIRIVAPKRIYLDLDRTLLDTDAVMTALYGACGLLYSLSADTLRAEMRQHYHNIDDMTYYDFFGHLAAHNIDPTQAAQELREQLADQDFLYPDAHELLLFLSQGPYRLHILSFGKHDFQQFKYSLAPQLHSIPFTSVLYGKGRYLSEAGNVPSLLVDNQQVPGLPPTTMQFLLDREAPHDIIAEGAQYIRIRNLKDVETALTVGYNEPKV